MVRPELDTALVQNWKPYSHLFLVSDGANWVIGEEMKGLAWIAQQLGIQVADPKWLSQARCQSVFYGMRTQMMEAVVAGTSHRVGTAYFHGRPGSGELSFDLFFEALCRYHERVTRLQVTHSEMQAVALSTGIAPEKVFRIPIGINLPDFKLQTPESRGRARQRYHIPQAAVVIGSFQKDGNGWGEGLEPKLIKGPDIFLRVIAQLKERVPELFVLLTGPARGYVKHGLEQLNVPYQHVVIGDYREMGELYQALDLYLVPSRQEGGPKAILESMACGIPLLTTRVGQAMDLVQHGRNGWMVEVDDVESLVHWSTHVLEHRSSWGEVLQSARWTAEANAHEAQVPLWQKFTDGFVEI